MTVMHSVILIQNPLTLYYVSLGKKPREISFFPVHTTRDRSVEFLSFVVGKVKQNMSVGWCSM